MESSQHMETPSQSSNEATPLCDKWVLWAHLPHDTDWTIKSYIKIMEFNSLEKMIIWEKMEKMGKKIYYLLILIILPIKKTIFLYYFHYY